MLTEADIKKTGDDPSGQGVDTGTAGEIGTKKRAVARKSISKPAAPVVVHDITDDMEDDLPPEEKEQHRKWGGCYPTRLLLALPYENVNV